MIKNKNMIHRILDDLANEAIPTNENPWDGIQKILSMKKDPLILKNKKITGWSGKNQRWVTVRGMLIFSIIIILALFASLPQGRVWAQQILHFFIRDKDEIALPTSIPVNMVEITPGTMQPTSTPINTSGQFEFYDQCGGLPTPYCSGEEIRELVSFPVKGLIDLPTGMFFAGATGGKDGITLVYQIGETREISLLLNEGPTTDAALQAIPVGSSADIEEVQINGNTGEYVKGSYFNYAGDTSAIWTSDIDLQSLRWEEDGMLYTISLFSSADSAFLEIDKSGLIHLAESLSEKADLSVKNPAQNGSTTISKVEKEAGFSIKVPEWLPENIQFKQATYLADQKMVCLEYQYPADQQTDTLQDTAISILESVVTPLPDINDLVFSNLLPDQIALYTSNPTVGGAVNGTGLYAYGSIDGSRICGSRFQNQVLEVQMEDMNITIFARQSASISPTHNWMTLQEMVQLAESITGVQTTKKDQIDPDYITSETTVKDISSFTLKFATVLPEGMNFTYAQYQQNGNEQEVILHYSDGNQIINISQIKGSTNSLENYINQNPEIYHEVTVHGQPAILTQGYWDDKGWKDIPNGGDGGASVIWFEDGIEYMVGGFNNYPSAIWLEIAESLE